MKDDAVIITLAYPETIVMVAEEWYSKYLFRIGIGKRNYVRAGHAAMVLINKARGVLEYHDFGRYITPEPYGRVRGRDTDAELNFPLKATFECDSISNLEDILKFLGTHPKLTHGEGKLVASVCTAVNYNEARTHISARQAEGFIYYAAFKKVACNCARFVTDALIAGVTDEKIKRKLIASKRFTPSTVGNVVIADTENYIYQVSEAGEISEYTDSVSKANRRYFLDRLQQHQPSFVGTLEPRENEEKQSHAQWLPGIAAGAWFELYDLGSESEFRFRRISPYANVDIDGVFTIEEQGFRYDLPYQFVQYSNCLFFHVEQEGKRYKFNFKDTYSPS
ncbi:hypothetical protein Q2T40_15140 [Winogradskyella maritima]|uniref:DUF6695 family protein n=1 Tax=Winogradskyella maritima TaxID=1517766 RepID=A0ABV8AG30_9FLAO|nr:hypothetical protein [Winogradskyella maritima]